MSHFKRGMFFFIGLLFLSFGITLTIVADLGTGAWDALNIGLANRTPFTVGNWVIFIGVLLICLNALLGKRRPEVVSIITVLILGYLIDFWLLIVFKDIQLSNLFLQLGILVFGIVCMGMGIATYLQANFAIIPIDRFMLVIQEMLKVKVSTAKTVAEVIALIMAFLAGGPIGVGTILVTFLMGPVIQTFYPRIEKLTGREKPS
ncbi:YczE/YyaS/YitT family protein [Halalkalibacterium ligniniphilum]|uniref:YczE/YyaS/YitT family protein n=1 Tax=Halalkalibacterium ligniniphilum TaxID=1134413 RepID=UPI00034DD872|nr:DUF6198 family protein [Halalkalibacterium ligniniphilum]